jgi:hypothetical protein
MGCSAPPTGPTQPINGRRRSALALIGGVAIACSILWGAIAQPAGANPPPIKHVFLIVLENESESTSFARPAPAGEKYLAETLPNEGAFVPNYYGIGHSSLDNYIAMISGQAPNPSTQADCPIFSAIAEVSLVQGQEPSAGCVYPHNVPTLPKQIEEAGGLTWRSYDESMGNEPLRDGGTTCAHPEIGTDDKAKVANENDAYATRHDPFVYFNSIISREPSCKEHVVNLQQLKTDLESEGTTRNYTFITPDLCDDGHESSCPNGRLGGLESANKFLETWVPKITASKAFEKDGLLIITFDEGVNDSTSCCGETPGPTTTTPGGTEPGGGSGGGRVGAVLLSPFIKAETVTTAAYNHYSMLASVETYLGLSRIGCAAGTTPFGSDIFKSEYSSPAPESAPPCYVPPASGGSTTTTTTTTTTATHSSPPACVATVISPKARGKLGANRVFGTLTVKKSGKVASLSFTALHGAKLKITARTSTGRSKTVASRSLTACHAYTFKLPAGHGKVTVVATVGHASQTSTHSY